MCFCVVVHEALGKVRVLPVGFAHKSALWTEHISFPLHREPVTTVDDGLNGRAAAQWRPNAEVPVEVAVGSDKGCASASRCFDVDYGARREIFTQH
jgi:hypothetical protein